MEGNLSKIPDYSRGRLTKILRRYKETSRQAE